MHKTLILAARDYRAAVKTKGFIIGLVLAPIFMGGSLIVFSLMKDRVDTKDKTVVILDRSGVLAPALENAAQQRNEREVHDPETGKKLKPAYHIDCLEPNDVDPEAQRLALSNRVRRGQLHAYVEIGRDVVHPQGGGAHSRVTYHAKNAAMDDLRNWMGQPINNTLRKLRLADAGVEESQIEGVFNWVSVEGMGLVSRDAGTGRVQRARRASPIEAILVPIIAMMLMLLRQTTPESIPLWQPILGLIGVLGCTVLFVWLGGRIFRVAILLQGTPPKLGNLLRWALRG